MMNYQKLLSRFYNSNDQNNGEIQKGDSYSGMVSDDTTEPTNGDFDFQTHEDVSMYGEVDASVSTWDQALDPTNDIVEPVTSEQVRWFYKSTDEKLWSEFNGYDSLLIENKYRELRDIKDVQNEDDVIQLDKVIMSNSDTKNVHTTFYLDSSESKAGVSESLIKKTKKEDNKCIKNMIKSIESEKYMEYNNVKSDAQNENINVRKITVRGGMYEVDLITMTCESIYWPGEQYAITRGLYFYDGSWQPLEGCYGEVLEEEHLRLFSQKKCDNIEKPSSQTGIAVHSHHFTDFHVEWLSSSDIYLYWGGAPRQLVRSVTQKLGFYQSTGYRLKRGYKKRATDEERPLEITHVVFVIHGIGQKMDSGRIIRNTNALRNNCDWIRSQYFNRETGEYKGRAELFPARWRAGERGDAAELLAAASPLGAPALRRAINDAAMDVMYYTSPIYGKQVQDDLTHELNRLYTMFMARNPGYKGSFSAVAHSLGCVILYDVITGYQMGCERCTNMDGACSENTNSGLKFKLQQLFCLGSPLGVFLSLRQPTPGSPRLLPTNFNTRLYNIFHLSDPVAYRLEPLIASWLAKHPPLVIPPHHSAPINSPSAQASPAKAPWKIWSYVKHPWQRSETGSPTPNSQNTLDVNCDSSHKYKTTPSPRKSPVNLELENTDNEKSSECKDGIDQYECDNDTNFDICTQELEEDKTIGIIDDESQDEDSTNIERNPDEVLPYRIDFTLRDSFITNNYIWAITSHTGYWNNYDVAHFILSRLLLEDSNDGDLEVSNIPGPSNKGFQSSL